MTLLLAALLSCGPRPPSDMVPVGDFWMDPLEYPNRKGEKPRTYVNLDEARQACAAAGKRLCTAAEWRRACLGPARDRRYGYGATFDRRKCHTSGGLPSGHTSMMDPTALVSAGGDYPDCRTVEGVWDMVGNVEEWVLDDWNGLEGSLEGGAWYTWDGYADCTGRYSREPDYRVDPERRVYSAGFRCCWSPDAPDEASLTPQAIGADARARLAAHPASEAPYDPSPEVQVAPGLFMDTFEYPNRPGAYPRVATSWTEAQQTCTEAGKRLCSTAEWERACGGSEHLPLPYGPDFVPSACAVELAEPSPSGAWLGCASEAGARDLVGGVWEWTADTLDVPGLAGKRGRLREIRGGSWLVDRMKATCRPHDGYPAAPESATFPDLGFRCCRGDPLPDDLSAHPGSLACPEGMVAVGSSCVDAHEFPNAKGLKPTANLDLAGARMACGSQGKHVCTWDEWLLACGGPSHRRWPYGNTFVPDRCNDESQARQEKGGGALASGERADCRTPEGVWDQSGNLWEWVETSGGSGILAGGGWNISAGLGQCDAVARPSADFKNAETGTRCCATAAEAARLGGAPR